MLESQKTISQWAHETFGECKSLDVIFERFRNEVDELEAYVNNIRLKKIPDELADCLIVLFQVANYLDIDLCAEVDRKMRINRLRKWKLHGDGTGQHVED